MEFMAMVAFLGTAAVCLIAVGAICVALWLGEGAERPLLLYPMLCRQGDEVARIAIASGSRDFAVAVKRCLHCPATEQCRTWLDSGNREGIEAFCGNAGYVSSIRGLTTRWS